MYNPAPVPPTPDALPSYLGIELQGLAQSLAGSQPFLLLQTLNVQPPKPREGMVAKADGTNWNPGSGPGVYVYRTTWRLLDNDDISQAFSPAAAGTVTVDTNSGLSVIVTFPAGNITIAAPTHPVAGQTLSFGFIQDATGGRTITWNAVFKKAADGAGGANQRGATGYLYDGTNWVQRGALAYF